MDGSIQREIQLDIPLQSVDGRASAADAQIR
jgi:hypothetical protein